MMSLPDSIATALESMRAGHNVLIVVPHWPAAEALWDAAAYVLEEGERAYRDAGREHIGRHAGGWIQFRTRSGIAGVTGYNVAILDDTTTVAKLEAGGPVRIIQFPAGGGES